MDRRELFKTIAGVAAASGVVATASVVEASAPAVPVLAVLEVDGPITTETAHRIRDSFEHAMAGTAFKDVKALVLSGGMRLTMLDAHGRVLNQKISEP